MILALGYFLEELLSCPLIIQAIRYLIVGNCIHRYCPAQTNYLLSSLNLYLRVATLAQWLVPCDNKILLRHWFFQNLRSSVQEWTSCNKIRSAFLSLQKQKDFLLIMSRKPLLLTDTNINSINVTQVFKNECQSRYKEPIHKKFKKTKKQCCTGDTVVQPSALLPHTKNILGSILRSEPFCVGFALSPCVYVASLRVLWLPTVQKNAKSVCVLTVGDCFCLWVNPAMNWRLV